MNASLHSRRTSLLHDRRPRFGRTPEEASRTDRPGVCPIGGTRQEPLLWARAGLLWLRGADGCVERVILRDAPTWGACVRRRLSAPARGVGGRRLTPPGAA